MRTASGRAGREAERPLRGSRGVHGPRSRRGARRTPGLAERGSVDQQGVRLFDLSAPWEPLPYLEG